MITLDDRRGARDAVSHPGKFQGEDPMVPILWGLSLEGMEDEWTSSEGLGFYCRIGKWILHESDSGFVYGGRFPTVTAAAERFAEIDAEISESEDGDDDDSSEGWE